VTNSTLLPPDHQPHDFWSLSPLTEIFVLLFALEPCSLHESIFFLLYVALRLPFFQYFHSWETRRVITLHFIKSGHYCYPAGDIRPKQRMKRGKLGLERKNCLNGRLNWMVAEQEQNGDGNRA
jgi:hypothetical protein